MKKLFAVTAITLATAGVSSAMADTGMFVGIEYGKAKLSADAEVNAPSLRLKGDGSDSENVDQYGIRIGSYINKNIRIYGNLNQAKQTEGGLTLTNRQLIASADYVFDTGYPVKPFIGASLGGNWFEGKALGETESNWALAYGGQAGVMGQFGQFDVELGYRYLKHNNEFKDSYGSNYAKVEFKDSKTPYLAVSYKF